MLCEAGDIIPLDGEVIEGIASVDESAITGESAPVIRESGGDRSAVTGGTRVISDGIVIRITAEPGNTFLDRMIAMVEGASRQKTPNEIALGILLVALTIVFIAVVLSLPAMAGYIEDSARALGFRADGHISLPVLVSLLVCLIPTTIGGLLRAIGISGIDRLVRRNVLATSGRAVEAAGDIDVLMLDKTGTITFGNRMANEFLPAPGVEDQQLAEAAQLASLSDETPEGRSIVVLAKKQFGIRGRHMDADHITFVPFSASTRMSGVDIAAHDGQPAVSIRKGAAESVAQWVKDQGGAFPQEVEMTVQNVARAGGTPLVVARGRDVLGVIYLKDIVKGGIKERFARLRAMGIRTVMVTGDNALTAASIAAEAGVDDFIAEATPEMKLARIREEQAEGHLVAMTGDGTNDAPALNAAQVGLSMGDGTTVAKEASAITILDNSFMSISRAVMWGRSLYRNIQRFIVFQMTINVAACLIVLIGAFLGTESPLTVTQMLWVNLIMDTFAALALASLPPDERVMQDPPRKTTDHIITRPMGRNILGVGILFVAFLFGLLQYFKHADVTSLTQFSLSGYFGSYLDFSSPEHELTGYELSLFFTIFVLLQFWNMFNAKAFNTHQSAFARMGASIGGFGVVALLILAGQYLIVTFGGKMFNVVPLSWTDWGIIFAGTSLVLWIGELVRAFTPDKSSARP